MGQRQWDPALLDYLGEKRQRAVQQAYDDLAMMVHDPLDPAQRKKLESILPNMTRSKQEVFEAVQEQRGFIERCALQLDISPSEWARLVRILGAGEQLLRHPLDTAFGEASLGGSNTALLEGDATWIARGMGRIPGLFGFATATMANREGMAGKKVADTRAARTLIATQCIHHFPRMLTGAYDIYNKDGAPRTKREEGAKAVVKMCERMVAEMIPLGNVADRYLAQAAQYGEKAKRVPTRAFENAFATPEMQE